MNKIPQSLHSIPLCEYFQKVRRNIKDIPGEYIFMDGNQIRIQATIRQQKPNYRDELFKQSLLVFNKYQPKSIQKVDLWFDRSHFEVGQNKSPMGSFFQKHLRQLKSFKLKIYGCKTEHNFLKPLFPSYFKRINRHLVTFGLNVAGCIEEDDFIFTSIGEKLVQFFPNLRTLEFDFAQELLENNDCVFKRCRNAEGRWLEDNPVFVDRNHYFSYISLTDKLYRCLFRDILFQLKDLTLGFEHEFWQQWLARLRLSRTRQIYPRLHSLRLIYDTQSIEYCLSFRKALLPLIDSFPSLHFFGLNLVGPYIYIYQLVEELLPRLAPGITALNLQFGHLSQEEEEPSLAGEEYEDEEDEESEYEYEYEYELSEEQKRIIRKRDEDRARMVIANRANVSTLKNILDQIFKRSSMLQYLVLYSDNTRSMSSGLFIDYIISRLPHLRRFTCNLEELTLLESRPRFPHQLSFKLKDSTLKLLSDYHCTSNFCEGKNQILLPISVSRIDPTKYIHLEHLMLILKTTNLHLDVLRNAYNLKSLTLSFSDEIIGVLSESSFLKIFENNNNLSKLENLTISLHVKEICIPKSFWYLFPNLKSLTIFLLMTPHPFSEFGDIMDVKFLRLEKLHLRMLGSGFEKPIRQKIEEEIQRLMKKIVKNYSDLQYFKFEIFNYKTKIPLQSDFYENCYDLLKELTNIKFLDLNFAIDSKSRSNFVLKQGLLLMKLPSVSSALI